MCVNTPVITGVFTHVRGARGAEGEGAAGQGVGVVSQRAA